MKTRLLSTQFLFAFALAIHLIGCAAIQPPPGGPEDKTPPAILIAAPIAGSLNVPFDTKLHFEFSVPLNRQSFQQAFSITPYVNGTIKYDWSGYDEVDVELPEKLRLNTTYTVSLGRDLKSHRGNALETPLHLTFSTGPYIDTAQILGVLLPALNARQVPKFSDMFVFAYDISEHNADTLNLTHTRPDLITQPDDKGLFQFFAMKSGHSYRLFAIQDVYRNKIYDVGVDAFGLPTRDVRLDSVVTSDVRIRLATQPDTSKPLVEDIEVADSLHLRARFSEAIDSGSVRAGNFKLIRTTGQGENLALGAFRDKPDNRPNAVTLLLTTPLVVQTEYDLRVRSDSVRDIAGNRLSDSAGASHFTTPASLLGARPLVFNGFSINDSTRDQSQSISITTTFSDAVDRSKLEPSLILTDTAGKVVPIEYSWVDDARLAVRSKDTLKPQQFYTLTIKTAGVRSPHAAILPAEPDTLHRIRFQTASLRDFGRIAGTILIADSLLKPQDNIVVELIGTTSSEHLTTRLPSGEKHYVFERVFKGRYRARAYVERSGIHGYDPGSLVPFRFAEPSGDFPQEIDVRPRWEIDKLDFEVK